MAQVPTVSDVLDKLHAAVGNHAKAVQGAKDAADAAMAVPPPQAPPPAEPAPSEGK